MTKSRADYRRKLNTDDQADRVAAVERNRSRYGNLAEAVTDTKHRNAPYRQRTRLYGDYLWHQDRDMFEVNYAEWCAAGCPL